METIKTMTDISNYLISNYKKGKGFNEGGLSFVKNREWEGLLVGVFINMKVGFNPDTFEIVKVSY